MLINTVNINEQFTLHTTSDHTFAVQKLIGTTLCDSLEVPFNTVDNTSTLTASKIDILQSLHSKASGNNVYTKEALNHNDISYGIALTTKADKSNSYLKTEINTLLIR